MLAGMVPLYQHPPRFVKMPAKQGSLELGFEFRQWGDFTDWPAVIPDRGNDETERAFVKTF